MTHRALLVTFLLGGLFGARASAQTFVRYVVPKPEGSETFLLLDADGDGRQDLLFPRPAKGGKPARLFRSPWWKRGAAKGERAVFSFPADVALYDVGRVGSEGEELLLLGARGLETAVLLPERFGPVRRIAPIPSIFSGVRSVPLPARSPFAIDLDGDGRVELLVPQYDRIAIYRFDAEGGLRAEAPWFVIPVSPKSTVAEGGGAARGEVRLSYRLPAVRAHDIDRDGRLDLVVVGERRLHLFLQSKSGTFPEKGIVIDLPHPTQTEQEEGEVRIGNGREDFANLVHLGDLDDDGMLDLVISRTSIRESLFNPKTQFEIYLGRLRPTPSFPEKPDHVIVSEGTQGPRVRISDIDGDGRMDIGIPSIRLGLWKIVKILTSGRATLTYAIYPMRQRPPLFPAEPVLRREISIAFRLSGEKEVRVPVLDFSGDFNGDGLADLLSGDGERLEVFLQRADHHFPESPDFTYRIALPKNGAAIVVRDLDGDGRSDILIPYDAADAGEARRIEILLTV
ncbi:MAG: VCBS repeat-containing protein [Deltaproteobacteria bacterium]|nr:MAG: VCBS repeat-containing protein [Deltaproteobacteria bacterium]